MLACYQVDPKKSTNQLATMSCLIIRTFRVLAPPSKYLQCLAELNQPPLLGFAVRPSIDILDRDCVFGAGVATRSGPSVPPRNALRPCGFSPLRRIDPRTTRENIASRSRSWGSSCFMRMSGGHLPRQSRHEHRNSHDAFRTLRRIPLVDSRTASPQPLPSCRSSRTSTIPKYHGDSADPDGLRSTEVDPHTSGRSLRKRIDPVRQANTVTSHSSPRKCELWRDGFKAFLNRRVRSVVSPLPVRQRPILPWALFPFKVHSDAFLHP